MTPIPDDVHSYLLQQIDSLHCLIPLLMDRARRLLDSLKTTQEVTNIRPSPEKLDETPQGKSSEIEEEAESRLFGGRILSPDSGVDDSVHWDRGDVATSGSASPPDESGTVPTASAAWNMEDSGGGQLRPTEEMQTSLDREGRLAEKEITPAFEAAEDHRSSYESAELTEKPVILLEASEEDVMQKSVESIDLTDAGAPRLDLEGFVNEAFEEDTQLIEEPTIPEEDEENYFTEIQEQVQHHISEVSSVDWWNYDVKFGRLASDLTEICKDLDSAREAVLISHLQLGEMPEIPNGKEVENRLKLLESEIPNMDPEKALEHLSQFLAIWVPFCQQRVQLAIEYPLDADSAYMNSNVDRLKKCISKLDLGLVPDEGVRKSLASFVQRLDEVRARFTDLCAAKKASNWAALQVSFMLFHFN